MSTFLDSIGYSGWILHALIFLPILGSVLAFWASEATVKRFAFWWSSTVFVLAIGLWWAFEPGEADLQLTTVIPWISSWGIHYAAGIDGISLFMVLLTAFITPITILGSFNYIQKNERAFYSLMLLLQGGVMGVFLALDLFLFYVFFEAGLIPMFLPDYQSVKQGPVRDLFKDIWSGAEIEPEPGPGREAVDPLRAAWRQQREVARERMIAKLDSSGLHDGVTLVQTPDGPAVQVEGSVLFSSGQAVVTKGRFLDRRALDALVR